MKKLINNILHFIVRWENRNTYCLFQIGYTRPEYIKDLAKKGITLVPTQGLEGDKVKIVRLGKEYNPVKIKIRKKK